MTETTDASRFLEDIPANLLVGKTRTGRPTSSFSSSASFYRTPSPSETRWTVPPPPRSAPVAQPISRFQSGDRVKHVSFGEGIVQESRIQDNDEIVVIEFKSVGLKRLAASLANLEIL
jgi:DNA helicase-2/ATP-dependent DNA helicase PcrA